MFFKKKKKEKEIKVETTNISKRQDWAVTEGQLVVDVYETDRDIVIQSAIAGIKNNQVDIALENDMIIIKGERENPIKDNNKAYLTKECYFGPFSREIIIPKEIDTSRIEAKTKEGILTIRLPKIERAKNKKIKLDDTEKPEK